MKDKKDYLIDKGAHTLLINVCIRFRLFNYYDCLIVNLPNNHYLNLGSHVFIYQHVRRVSYSIASETSQRAKHVIC